MGGTGMHRDGRTAVMAGNGMESSTRAQALLALLTALLLCLGLTATRANAAPGALCSTTFATPANLPGSTFEGHDGDQCDRPDLNQLIDWENVVNAGEFLPGGNATAIQD